MKRIIKFVSIFSIICLLGILFLKLWWQYENKYLCVPLVSKGISHFLLEVSTSTYEQMQHKTIFFESNKAFDALKADINENYTVSIEEWSGGMEAHVVLKFKDDKIFSLVMSPENAGIVFNCVNTSYRVETVY